MLIAPELRLIGYKEGKEAVTFLKKSNQKTFADRGVGVA
jgi:hypothetical protein